MHFSSTYVSYSCSFYKYGIIVLFQHQNGFSSCFLEALTVGVNVYSNVMIHVRHVIFYADRADDKSQLDCYGFRKFSLLQVVETIIINYSLISTSVLL